MSETKENKPAPAEATPPKKGSAGIVGLLLPALLAGGASFGGVKLSAAHAALSAGAPEHAAVVEAAPPGPTVALDPFLVLTQDTSKKTHAMKLTIAVEFNDKAKEETLKSFTPRIRDAALGYLRVLSYEDALDSGKTDKLRNDLLERFRQIGATSAQRVLITDLVLQ
jgi:flagellar basal body-associated protein FliL